MESTILLENHKKLNATFGEFGGYNMPLWYESAKNEHLNVLKNVGIFDTSHMSFIWVEGEDSYNLLESSFSRDIRELKIGKSIYGLFLTNENHVLDDALLYMMDIKKYFIVVNASMSERVIKHLKSFNYNKINIINYSNLLGKIDVQGPQSLVLMERIFDKNVFIDFPYFTFKGSFLNGEVLISRSGYTGEFGFELFVEKDKAQDLWKELLSKGEDLKISPCGLAARDSLRVGAGLPLSHQDFGSWEFVNTPWDFAVTNSKNSDSSFTYAYVGYDVRKLHNNKGSVLINNEKIGEVLSCVTEVSLTRIDNKILSVMSKELPVDFKVKGLVAGFIKVNKKLDYEQVVILSDNKRELKVEIVKTVRPEKTSRKSIKNIRSLL